MKTKIIFLCAVFLMTHAITYGQKTEVRVQKGKVITQTAGGTVTVDAGQKAVLTRDKEPLVSIDDPMVDDLIDIYKWVEQEKQAQREKIDSSSIMIYRIEKENIFTVAALQDKQNLKPEPSSICQTSSRGVLANLKFYDLDGNLLPFDTEQKKDSMADYFVHFTKLVEPGELFRYIAVCKLSDNSILWKEGPLWHFQGGGSAGNCLNYFRLILPESAVFVDSSWPVTLVDNVDGRVTLTIRNYRDQSSNGRFHIAFLWPDKDGTTLTDVPPQYRGLRNQQEEDFLEKARLEIVKIQAGETFEDQSTPLKTLLTTYNATVHKDKELLLNLVDPGLRKQAVSQMGMISSLLGMANVFEFLETSSWPEKPNNGYTHAIYLCRKGSLLCEATIVMVYQNGKWYLQQFWFGGKKIDRIISDSNAKAGKQ